MLRLQVWIWWLIWLNSVNCHTTVALHSHASQDTIETKADSKDTYIAALEEKLKEISGVEVEQIRKNHIANAQAHAFKEMANYVDAITVQSAGTATAGVDPQSASIFKHINPELGGTKDLEMKETEAAELLEESYSREKRRNWRSFLGKECSWNMASKPPQYPPIILKKINGIYIQVLPVLEHDASMARVQEGTVVTIACSGSGRKLSNSDFSGENFIRATCDNGNLYVDNKKYVMEDMGCNAKIQSSVKKKLGGANCGDNNSGDLYSIGFDIGTIQDQFSLITVCFGRTSGTTLWSEHKIFGQHIAAREEIEHNKRPEWSYEEGLFPLSKEEMRSAYNYEKQIKLMEAKGIDIIMNKTTNVFSRGHLSPKSDFITNADVEATFNLINALPQWQVIAGNWGVMEDVIVELAKTRNTDLRIITGGHGILNLESTTNAEVPIYLGETPTVGKKAVPVSKYMWKIVFEDKEAVADKKAVAFVTINNPLLVAPGPDLCDNVCGQLKWLDNLKVKDIDHGYIYCCQVGELINLFPDVPNIGTVGLLV